MAPSGASSNVVVSTYRRALSSQRGSLPAPNLSKIGKVRILMRPSSESTAEGVSASPAKRGTLTLVGDGVRASVSQRARGDGEGPRAITPIQEKLAG
jgi:hypothetical protein